MFEKVDSKFNDNEYLVLCLILVFDSILKLLHFVISSSADRTKIIILSIFRLVIYTLFYLCPKIKKSQKFYRNKNIFTKLLFRYQFDFIFTLVGLLMFFNETERSMFHNQNLDSFYSFDCGVKSGFIILIYISKLQNKTSRMLICLFTVGYFFLRNLDSEFNSICFLPFTYLIAYLIYWIFSNKTSDFQKIKNLSFTNNIKLHTELNTDFSQNQQIIDLFDEELIVLSKQKFLFYNDAFKKFFCNEKIEHQNIVNSPFFNYKFDEIENMENQNENNSLFLKKIANLKPSLRSFDDIETTIISLSNALKIAKNFIGKVISIRVCLKDIPNIKVNSFYKITLTAIEKNEEVFLVILMNQDLEKKINDSKLMVENQTRMISYVAHDFRTPLNSIFSCLQTIQTKLKDEYIHMLVEPAISSTKFLFYMTNDLLDMAQLKEGRIKMIESKFNLKIFLKNIVGLFKLAVEAKKIELNINIDEKIPELIVNDPDRIRQILINLISK